MVWYSRVRLPNFVISLCVNLPSAILTRTGYGAFALRGPRSNPLHNEHGNTKAAHWQLLKPISVCISTVQRM